MPPFGQVDHMAGPGMPTGVHWATSRFRAARRVCGIKHSTSRQAATFCDVSNATPRSWTLLSSWHMRTSTLPPLCTASRSKNAVRCLISQAISRSTRRCMRSRNTSVRRAIDASFGAPVATDMPRCGPQG